MIETRPPETAHEQRAAPRRQPAMGTIYRLGANRNLGLVWNISPGGVSMLVHDRLETGTAVRGELATPDNGFALPVSLRVAHVSPLRTGDFIVGGKFDRPLAPDELRPFLSGPVTR